MMFTRQQVKAMIGEWPDSGNVAGYPSGFLWSEVDHFELIDGELVPFSGGLPMDGPNLKLQMVPSCFEETT